MQNILIILILFQFSSCAKTKEKINFDKTINQITLNIIQHIEYKPEQPIPFSHKAHENINIDCSYCHHSKEKQK
jgi:hypothetical protein